MAKNRFHSWFETHFQSTIIHSTHRSVCTESFVHLNGIYFYYILHTTLIFLSPSPYSKPACAHKWWSQFNCRIVQNRWAAAAVPNAKSISTPPNFIYHLRNKYTNLFSPLLKSQHAMQNRLSANSGKCNSAEHCSHPKQNTPTTHITAQHTIVYIKLNNSESNRKYTYIEQNMCVRMEWLVLVWTDLCTIDLSVSANCRCADWWCDCWTVCMCESVYQLRLSPLLKVSAVRYLACLAIDSTEIELVYNMQQPPAERKRCRWHVDTFVDIIASWLGAISIESRLTNSRFPNGYNAARWYRDFYLLLVRVTYLLLLDSGWCMMYGIHSFSCFRWWGQLYRNWMCLRHETWCCISCSSLRPVWAQLCFLFDAENVLHSSSCRLQLCWTLHIANLTKLQL